MRKETFCLWVGLVRGSSIYIVYTSHDVAKFLMTSWRSLRRRVIMLLLGPLLVLLEELDQMSDQLSLGSGDLQVLAVQVE